MRVCSSSSTMEFQSTLPARGATRRKRASGAGLDISIHAPRTGSDTWLCFPAETATNFNPRSPHGERRAKGAQALSPAPFQSTLPARGATDAFFNAYETINHFNPRSPHGERHQTLLQRGWFTEISIHAPRTGSDRQNSLRSGRPIISIHAPRTGSDTSG